MRKVKWIAALLALLVLAILAGSALADAPAGATPITPGTQATVTISTGGEFKYFSFTPAETAYYTFTSFANEIDTCALLYDAHMRTLAYDDESAPTGNDFRLIYPLEAGKTYYFAAGLYDYEITGDFPVRLENQGALLAMAADRYVDTFAGQAVTLRVLPFSDNDLTYQWYRVSGDNMTLLVGETHSSLALLTPTRSADYICRVAGGGKTQDISVSVVMENDAWLFPGCETEIHANPDSQPVTFSVRATSNAGSVSLQWYHSTYDENGNGVHNEIAGATGNTYTVSDTRSGEYFCKAINGDGDENEVWFQLIVDNGLKLKSVSDNDMTIACGGSTTLSVQAQANAGELSYQWYTLEDDDSIDEVIFTPIPGATSASYTTGSLTEYAGFACRVTDIYGNNDETSFWIDVEGGGSGFYIEPAGSLEFEIESDAEVQMAVTTKNATGSVAYRWYRGEYNYDADRFFYAPIPGATGTSYEATGITRTTRFLCVAECDGKESSVDFFVTLNDINSLEIARDPESYYTQVDYGGSIELQVTASGETGDVSYQWFRDNAPIPGATGASYTCEGIYGHTMIRCRVQDDNEVRWGYFELYVDHSDNGGLSVSADGDQDMSVKPGDSASLKVTPVDENLTYQWVKREKIPYGYYRETTVIEGANQATLDTGAIYRETSFYCNVTDGVETACIAFDIDIDSGLSVESALDEGATMIYVTPNESASLGVDATTKAGSLSYRWYVSSFDEDDGYYWGSEIIPGATGASYTTPAVTKYVQYSCEVKDGYNEKTIWFYVYPDSGFSAEAATDTEITVEPDKTFTMAVDAETQAGTLTYQWSVSDYNYEFEHWENNRPVDDANGDSYTVTNLTAKAQYTCHVSDGYNSADIRFYVYINNGLTAEGERDTYYYVELGDDVTLSVTATTKMPGGVNYQWYKSEMDLSTGENGEYVLIPGAIDASYAVDDIAAQVSYYCMVSDGIQSVERHFYISINDVEFGIDYDTRLKLVPEGSSATLHVDATTSAGSLHYQWYRDEKPISGQTGADYTLSDFSGSTRIWCRVWNDFGQSGQTDDFLCATDATVGEIEAGKTAAATITGSSSLAVFRFVPEATAQYTFTSSANDDTFGYLFAGDGTKMTEDDDNGDVNNFQIEATLAAGQTYYLVARYYSFGKTGSFDVELTQGETVTLNTVDKGALALRVGQSVVMPRNYLNWEDPSAASSGNTSVLTTRGTTVTAVAPGTAQLSVMYLGTGESWVYSVTVYPDSDVLRLPASVTEVEEAAFEGDTSIRFVELGSEVGSISPDAFSGTGLVQIVFDSNYVSFDNTAFGNSKPTIVCPRDSNIDWKAVQYGLNYVYLP